MRQALLSLLAWPLKLADLYLVYKQTAFLAASAVYYVGHKPEAGT